MTNHVPEESYDIDFQPDRELSFFHYPRDAEENDMLVSGSSATHFPQQMEEWIRSVFWASSWACVVAENVLRYLQREYQTLSSKTRPLHTLKLHPFVPANVWTHSGPLNLVWLRNNLISVSMKGRTLRRCFRARLQAQTQKFPAYLLKILSFSGDWTR